MHYIAEKQKIERQISKNEAFTFGFVSSIDWM